MSELESYLKAGKSAAEVLKRVPSIIQEGMPILDLCEKIEDMILQLGVQISFPVNVAQDNEAAHYTASYNDTKKIKDNSVVKVDIGTHLDGFIADTAITISFNSKYDRLVKSNNEILSEALRTLRPGLKFSELGGLIEDRAREMGFGMIENLSGHRLDQYILHANESIPMIRTPVRNEFKPNTAYAIEPFLVERNESGFVVDGNGSNIMSLINPRRNKVKELDELTHDIWKKYRGLPFASRWLVRDHGEGVLKKLQELIRINALMEYPTLLEVKGGYVSQFEHTVFITEDGAVVTSER
ncbi:MAG: type II methionyl aminopeptidase [Thaumarchaeota archaeon]|nr:type II methionyl aminopeptidase [Nitrososphaerota archaeon]